MHFSKTNIILFIFATFIAISNSICGDVVDGDKNIFSDTNKNHSEEDMKKIVDHDTEVFTKVLFSPNYQTLVSYYKGMIRWIDKNGGKKHLPFLEKVLNKYKDVSFLKESYGHFDNYGKRDLYELALSAWYKIKSKNMSKEERVAMIIQSLKKESLLPKIPKQGWNEVEVELTNKRDEIYKIFKNGNINPLYDYRCPLLGSWDLPRIWKMQNLSPSKQEVSEFLNQNENKLLVDNIIYYLLKKNDAQYGDKIFNILVSRYKKAKGYGDIRSYSFLLYHYRRVMIAIGKLEKREEEIIEELFIEAVKKAKSPWTGRVGSDEINLFGGLLMDIYLFVRDGKKGLVKENKDFLRNYQQKIKQNLEHIYDAGTKGRLNDLINRIDEILKIKK